MISHVSDGSSWQLWSISDRSSWCITVGLGFHPQFLDLLLTKREREFLSRVHARTHTHAHTHTNNGFIMMVTLVMTYPNYFFDLNFNMCCHGNAPYKCAHSPLSQKRTTNLQSSSSNQSVENSLPHALSKQTSTCDP